MEDKFFRGTKPYKNTAKPQNPTKRQHRLNRQLARLSRRISTWENNPPPPHRTESGHVHHKPGSMKSKAPKGRK